MVEQAANPIGSIQRWMEEEIIGKGICVPLVKAAQNYTVDRKIDWTRFSEEVVIEDATHKSPDSEELLLDVSKIYLDFIHCVVASNAPLVRNVVLPDFSNNSDFDLFLKRVRENAFEELTSSEEGQDFALQAFLKLASKNHTPEDEVRAVCRKGPTSVAQVIERSFNTINFYGRRVTDKDLSDLPGDRDPRNPVDRYKMLGRAPYYLMQVINPIRGYEPKVSLDAPAMRRRNTALAARTNLDEYEERMADYRQNPTLQKL